MCVEKNSDYFFTGVYVWVIHLRPPRHHHVVMPAPHLKMNAPFTSFCKQNMHVELKNHFEIETHINGTTLDLVTLSIRENELLPVDIITDTSVTCNTLTARFMEPTWGQAGADRTQVGPILAPWTLLSGVICGILFENHWVEITP